MKAYIESWKLGLKAVAIYRDNSKRSQPLSAAGKKQEKKVEVVEPEQRELFARAQREKMPVERASVTHKFSVGGHEGYLTVGMYEDGRPGELFIKMAKEGSTLSGVMDGLALTISLGLQYGVPLKVFVDKLVNTRFEPSGIIGESEHPVRHFGAGLHCAVAGREVHLVGLPEAERNDGRGQSRFQWISQFRYSGDDSAAANERVDELLAAGRARGRADLLRVRHADGAERSVLQMRKLRQHQRLQLKR